LYNMFRKLIREQCGESILTLPILMLIICMVMYMGVDILGIYSAHQKLRTAASETLTLMKMENGWDSNTEVFFEQLIAKTGLSPANVTVTATPKGAQRGDTITLTASTNYEVRSLKPLNRTIIVPVEIEISGLAQEFKR
jgi:hypothetical protein